MQSYKLISIIVILGIFITFCCLEFYKKSESLVLDIISPVMFNVDLNGNKRFDDGETVCIENIDALTSNLSTNQSELINSLKISNDDGLKLGYLTDNFTDSMPGKK